MISPRQTTTGATGSTTPESTALTAPVLGRTILVVDDDDERGVAELLAETRSNDRLLRHSDAAVAPASATRFQLRMQLGAMSSSRSSSATAAHPSRCAGPSPA